MPVHTLYFPDESSLECIVPPNQRPGLDIPMYVLSGNRDDVPKQAKSDKWAQTSAASFQKNLSPLQVDRYPKSLLMERFRQAIEYQNKHYGLGLENEFGSLHEAEQTFYEGLGLIRT